MSASDESIAAVGTAEKLQALRSVRCYPVPATTVEVIETHFAWVFLAGEHAYKMKKPIEYQLLDLRSIENRHRNCLEEVRLNRRLAPDVYLGAVPLTLGKDGELRVGGEGSVVDWLVWMKRLPAHLMLDRAIAEQTVTSAALTDVAALLVGFYARQQRYFYPASHYHSQLTERTRAEHAALLVSDLGLDAARVDAAAAAVYDSLHALRPELGKRAQDGRVVEGHGDLRPEHICLAPPCVIDALEFSRQLRILDPAEELAFLRLECEIAGAPEIADQLVGAYQRLAQDSFSRPLLDCYQSCRALVRAKIAAWHVRDPAVMALAPWTEKAHAYLAIAARHARLACKAMS